MARLPYHLCDKLVHTELAKESFSAMNCYEGSSYGKWKRTWKEVHW